MAGGLFLQADFHLLGVQDLCFEGFFLVRQIIQKITVEDEETIRIHFRDSEMVMEQEL